MGKVSLTVIPGNSLNFVSSPYDIRFYWPGGLSSKGKSVSTRAPTDDSVELECPL